MVEAVLVPLAAPKELGAQNHEDAGHKKPVEPQEERCEKAVHRVIIGDAGGMASGRARLIFLAVFGSFLTRGQMFADIGMGP